MKKVSYFIMFFLFLIISFSCKQCNENKSHVIKAELPKEDTLNIKIHRYENALFGVGIKNLKQELKKLRPEFSFFLNDNLDDTASIIQIRAYLTDPLIMSLYDDCRKIYPDVKDLETQLSHAFRYFKFYFPDKKIPEVFTYISGLDYNSPVKYADSVLIVALDMYFGSKYNKYKMLGQPVYRQQYFRKDFILPDCMKEIALTMIDNTMESKKFIDHIVYEGKILYFLDAMLPDTPDSIKIKYSPSQMEWCNKNESNVWSYIIEKKILYTTDNNIIIKMCNDGPFTSLFSKQSPSRIGNWIGWQIVRSYMENNKKITVKELFINQDGQDILMKSKYKPQKNT
ncbi:MAG: hypothetical protein HGB12_02455 [Bacteroidetes bacterium]|nr:hypothetical protein [Bacteroidota bacterium]